MLNKLFPPRLLQALTMDGINTLPFVLSLSQDLLRDLLSFRLFSNAKNDVI